VPSVRYAALAEDDLDAIAAYTVRTWGLAQAARYVAALETCCEMLASSPERARSCETIAPGLWRFAQALHVVFFRKRPDGIRVLRVLHQRQFAELHEFEDDDGEDL
jgi:toxin ParE1/3/4